MSRDTLASLRAEIAALKERVVDGEMAILVAVDQESYLYPDAVEAFKVDDWTYVYRLWRATGAMGGIVQMIGRVEGQRAQVSFHRLDDLGYRYGTEYDRLHSLAVERLKRARGEML